MTKHFSFKKISFIFLFVLFSCQTTSVKNQDPIPSSSLRSDISTASAVGKKIAVSTQGRFASDAALEVRKLGGNLIDSFIAASFVISVERPHSTGIGGGGFLIYRSSKTKKIVAVDFRERAPFKATKNMFLDTTGAVVPKKSINGPLAVGIPGLVAGLYEIHKKFGKLPWSRLLQPAIRLAEEGFPVYSQFQNAVKYRQDVLSQNLEAKKIFLDESGNPLPEGFLLKQMDLAKTLKQIAKNGRDGFYKGFVANRITSSQKQMGGLITQKDLDQYQVHWREPVQSKYMDYMIFSMPPPSSGGIHVIQFLKMMSLYDGKDAAPYSANNLHYKAASLQSAFADRARYLGDPDFVHVPVQKLIDDSYLQKRFAEIPTDKARSADQVQAGEVQKPEHTETTHMSLMDDEGNAIASTQTINGYMGSGIVVPDTGILLNNEMDDFSAQVGASNLFGAIGSEANAVAPMKTPLSSMSPTLVLKQDEVVMSVGAPGGTRIISCVAQTIHNYFVHHMSLLNAVSSIRYHHQWKPDVLTLEPPGPSKKTLEKLRSMGYKVALETVPCNVMAVVKNNSEFQAVADPRDIGIAKAE